MKAKLVRNLKSSQQYIQVYFSDTQKEYLFSGIIEWCAQNLSINELQKVYAECNKQLSKMNPKDIPLTFQEMMKELQQTIINRKAFDK